MEEVSEIALFKNQNKGVVNATNVYIICRFYPSDQTNGERQLTHFFLLQHAFSFLLPSLTTKLL